MTKPNAAPSPPASTQPSDYQPLGSYYDENLQVLFGTFKAFEHHLAAVRDELESGGALVRVGRLLHVHRATFWPKFLAAQRALVQHRRKTREGMPAAEATT